MKTTCIAVPLITFILGAITNSCFAQSSDFKSYTDFVWQYQHIDTLQISATYTYEMTIQLDPSIYHNAKAHGPYEYLYDTGKSRVSIDLVAEEERSVFLEQKLQLSFDGNTHYIFDPVQNILETTAITPPAATSIPLNPALYPVAFLRGDLIPEILQGIEHFQNPEKCIQNIQSHHSRTDSNGIDYIELKLIQDPASTHAIPTSESTYRVYMTESTNKFSVPNRVEWWSNGTLAAAFYIQSYIPIKTESGTVQLPQIGSFIAYENDEAILEYQFNVSMYKTSKPDPSLFALKTMNHETSTISPDGIMRSSKHGTSATLPAPDFVPSNSDPDLTEGRPNSSTQNTTNGVAAGVIIIILICVSLFAFILYKKHGHG